MNDEPKTEKEMLKDLIKTLVLMVSHQSDGYLDEHEKEVLLKLSTEYVQV